ncbi:glycosyltransferase family 4 protein [Limnofasciculus baicalensis]|uniref:Glycosyltransferase family 4 protein n=1 Tax=Limnofasciculus baicalensis BBK-W-15 TaxID=2699891 RepID=A0AAE3KLP2_9CYAN|nr:glycosyltransferase family 4 protein [Limnofasciculus baicalensis]MCP2728309.1 glycosyltransferase family 4 protein [Limnofasciculus baicalensis BBK-W-15]
MKILAICSTFPYPPTRGGTHNRTFNLLKNLTQNHQVTIITQRPPEVTDSEVEGLRQWVAELVVFPRPKEATGGIIAKLKRTIEFLQKGTPPNVLYLYDTKIQQWIDEAVAAGKFDAITCEHSVNEVYIRPEWKKQINTVINIHSSVYRTCKNQLETGTSDNALRDRLYLPLLKRYEQNSVRKFSSIVVTTDEDWQQMQEFSPNSDVTISPNGVDLAEFTYRKADPGGHHLIFCGGLDYFVNINGACVLGREILPRLQEKYPDTTVTLVGSKPAPEVLALAENPAITVTGRVPSMTEYLHRATVCVVPLLSGFGMKIKTLEAMAAGVPVVGSDRGLEGLNVDGEGVPLRGIRANSIPEYVEAVTRLFEDAKLREELSKNARSFIEENYTWEGAAKIYEMVLERKG